MVAACWLAFVVLCGQEEARCRYKLYDYRASARAGCVRLKNSSTCSLPVKGCADVHLLQTLSPRWLATIAGAGGPMLTWVPLLFSSKGQHPAQQEVMAKTVMWYLSVIGLVRHLHWLSGWDPSGHLIVYASQFLPLWYTWLGSGVQPPILAQGWLLLWAAVLLYLSILTALAFHTTSETMAAATLVLPCAFWIDCSRGSTASGSLIALTVIVWTFPTALSWIKMDVNLSLLLAMLVYDLFCWLLLLHVMRVSLATVNDGPPDAASLYQRLCGDNDATAGNELAQDVRNHGVLSGKVAQGRLGSWMRDRSRGSSPVSASREPRR